MKYLFCLLITLFSFASHGKSITTIEGVDVLNGKDLQIKTADAKKGTVLVFLSAKCPCSASHEGLLNDLTTKYPDFVFVGIHSNSDEDAEMTRLHFSSAALKFPLIQDRKNKWANELGALKTPHAFVLNKNGEVVYSGGVTDSHTGPSAKNQLLNDVLEDLNAGKAPRIKEGRALGCFIQREDA
ncbi:MAG: redoxin family protein [Bacillota bacterium]